MVTVSGFYLDKYEVTVGRFKKFVGAYDAWRAAGHPSQDEGAHPAIPGSGWQKDWNPLLAANQSGLAGLQCDPVYSTWNPPPPPDDQRPMNCVIWYEAFAFCVWDGGRLPTEAEREYAAAGGSENRLFPWGETLPGPNADLAVYGCYWASGGSCYYIGNIPQVGSRPAGNGRWGHADLAGSMAEWTVDFFDAAWYSNAAASGTDVANVTSSMASASSPRVIRDTAFSGPAVALRSAYRNGSNPSGSRSYGQGLRCARTP
jgi:formylglycine-generating enzyme required for sulfatase activity